MSFPNQPSRTELDLSFRKTDNDFKSAINNLGALKSLIDGLTVQDLMNTDPSVGIAYGYSQVDVDNIKAYVAQHPLILATQPVQDAFTFGGRLSGLNFVTR